MSPHLFIAAVLLIQTPGGSVPAAAHPIRPAAVDAARAIVIAATRATERDSTAAVSARWNRALRTDSADGEALLGLGTLSRLSYEHAQAGRLYGLLVSRPADQFSVAGRLGLAEWERVHRSLREAARNFERAAEAARVVGDPNLEAEALVGVARVRARTDPPDTALALLARAERLLAGSSGDLGATVSCVRADVLGGAGRPGVRAAADAGLALARSARAGGVCWQTLGAHLVNTVDDPTATRVPFDSAEALHRSARDLVGLAQTLVARGGDRLSYLDLGAARADLDSGVAIARAVRMPLAGATGLRLLGQIAWITGDQHSAVRLQEAAESALAGYGDVLADLQGVSARGRLALRLGRLDEAETAYTSVLAAARTLQRPSNVYLARMALAWIMGLRGDWEGAHAETERVVDYMRVQGRAGWIDGLAYSRGVIALRRGDLETAERHFGTPLRRSATAEYLARHQAHSRLAELYAERGELDRAVRELDGATDELDSLRQTLPLRELRLLVFQASADAEGPDPGQAAVVASLARHGRAGEAFRLTERRRARELADRLLQAEFLAADGDHAGPADARGLTPASALPALDEHTALIEYAAGRRGQPTTIFVLTAGGLRAHVAAPLDSMAADLERVIALLRQGRAAGTPARRISAELLRPALTGLPAAVRRLVIVPDDVLHRLPFDALPLADGVPLVSRYAVGIAPSAAVAATLQARRGPGREPRVLALGDPEFARERAAAPGSASAVYRTAFEESGGLVRLAASAGEASAAARFGTGSVVRLRGEASEAFLKAAALDSFAVLHLATHALVSELTPSRTALALAPGGGEDGFVGPGEIAALRIGADLVVLSACRTASGVVIGGEGVQGLTAPLLQAGARAVLATLWPVRDQATGSLMRNFYTGLAGGRSASDALREAKLAAMRRGAPASEWAAFTLVGDPLVQVPLRPPRSGWQWSAGAAAVGALLALGYGAVMRRRRRSDAA